MCVQKIAAPKGAYRGLVDVEAFGHLCSVLLCGGAVEPVGRSLGVPVARPVEVVHVVLCGRFFFRTEKTL